MSELSHTEQTKDEPRLYGLPGAEILYNEPSEVWESEIDPWRPEATVGDTYVIEEWTTYHPIECLPDTDLVAEWLAETGSDNQGLDASWDHFERVSKLPEVREAIDNLLEVFASHIKYRQAKTMVATHELKVGEDGQPMLNGEPMYEPVRPNRQP